MTKIKEEIVHMMRGFFSMPVLSSLGHLGVLDVIISSPINSLNSFTKIENQKLLKDSLNYLAALGFIEYIDKDTDNFKATKLGKEIFKRCSSFYVPHSYNQYMHNFYSLLINCQSEKSQSVDRRENVIGSGMTHQRYFPPAISFLKRRIKFDLLADLGCGDGHFLCMVKNKFPNKHIVGIDISKTTIDVAYENINKHHPFQKVKMIQSDAIDIKNWGERLKKIAGKDIIALSMWFLLHEISKNNPDYLIEYFFSINSFFPDSPIILSELVRHDNYLLAENKHDSIMPEYLFFHDMSGQGILSWDDYKQILNDIPYKLSYEMVFDELTNNDGMKIPSSFVWCLVPK